jgi:hypothetical protein
MLDRIAARRWIERSGVGRERSGSNEIAASESEERLIKVRS